MKKVKIFYTLLIVAMCVVVLTGCSKETEMEKYLEELEKYEYIPNQPDNNFAKQMNSFIFDYSGVEATYKAFDVYLGYLNYEFNTLMYTDYKYNKEMPFKELYFFEGENIICGLEFEQVDLNKIKLISYTIDGKNYSVDNDYKIIDNGFISKDKPLELIGFELIKTYNVKNLGNLGKNYLELRFLNKSVPMFGENQQELEEERKTIDKLDIYINENSMEYTEILHTGEEYEYFVNAYNTSLEQVDKITYLLENINEENIVENMEKIDEFIISYFSDIA